MNFKQHIEYIYEALKSVVARLVIVETEKPKVYKALLSQATTGNPVATIIINTLGGEIVWTRINAGYYEGYLLNAFPYNKCNITDSSDFYKVLYYNTLDAPNAELRLTKVSTSVLLLTQNNGVAPLVDNFESIPIEIEVYP